MFCVLFAKGNALRKVMLHRYICLLFPVTDVLLIEDENDELYKKIAIFR